MIFVDLYIFLLYMDWLQLVSSVFIVIAVNDDMV